MTEIVAPGMGAAMNALTSTFPLPYKAPPTWKIVDKGIIDFQGDRYVITEK